ncbi:MAG: hypothetical protein K6C08_10355 [Oscillospiraceae bacterium]|nr:hypothetical protein [Oscillospiraceae bacterium]
MAKGITEKEPDPRTVYADIIDLPHHQSKKHPHMSLYDRAAQFSSYKALSGYEDMVAEEARITDQEIILSDEQLDRLGEKLELIADVIQDGESPQMTFTVFIPDTRKPGGRYEEITDRVKRIDAVSRKLVLMSTKEISGVNMTIDFDKIIDIHGDLVDYMDDIRD